MTFVFQGYDQPASSKSEGNSDKFVFKGYENKKQEPVTLKGSAGAFGSGYAGGAGGAVPDIAKLAKPIAPVSETASAVNQLIDLLGAKGTHELTESIQGQEPQNALERILQQSGQFSGTEGLIGAGVGGIPGAALGSAHGAASGALYGGLKELGLDDTWALGVTTLATLSPIAMEKLIPKIQQRIKSGVAPRKAIEEMVADRFNFEPGTPPPGAAKTPRIKEADLVKGVTGENLPISPYEVGEKELSEIKPIGFEPVILGKKVKLPSEKLGQGKSLSGRISQTETELKKGGFPLGLKADIYPKEGGKGLGGRITQVGETPVGHSISPLEFENEAKGGRGLHENVSIQSREERRTVTNAYKAAETQSKNVNSIADEVLLSDLDEEITRLKESIKPNTAESSVLKTVEEIRDYYRLRNGVSVNKLIRTSDSISGMANYELPFTGPKDILKRVANTLDQAAIRAVENNGGNAELIRTANRQYGRWADKFARDEIQPFLEKNPRNLEQLLRKASTDEATFRSLEKALRDAPKGKEYLNALARKIAESKMGHYSGKDLGKIGSVQYQKDLRNLEGVIGERRAAAFDTALREKRRIAFETHRKETPKLETKAKILPERVTSATKQVTKPSKVVTEAPKIRISPQRTETADNKLKAIAKKIAEHERKKPEDLLNKLNSRSGIKELKKEIRPQTFDTLIKQKGRTILQEGNLEAEFSGKDLYNVLNKEKNFEIFTEILGKEDALALRDAAKIIGDRNMSADRVKKVLGAVGYVAARATIGVKAYRVIKSLI